MHNIVLSEAEVYVQMGFSAIKTLIWMTEAIHQYQVLTGVSRCIQDLELDATSTDGKYTLDEDIDLIEKVEYYTNDQAIAMPVNMYDYDDFFRLVAQGTINPNVSAGFTAVQSQPFAVSSSQTNIVLGGYLPSPYYATRYGACNLIFYPNFGTSGFLRIYYKPYLTPYSPSAEGRWGKFGNPPDAMMKTAEIPREFQAALQGIKGYCMAKLIQSIRGNAKLFPGVRQEYMADFNNGVAQILKKMVMIGQDQEPTINMTGRLI